MSKLGAMICKACGQEKPLAAFACPYPGKDGKRKCIQCTLARAREYNKRYAGFYRIQAKFHARVDQVHAQYKLGLLTEAEVRATRTRHRDEMYAELAAFRAAGGAIPPRSWYGRPLDPKPVNAPIKP